MEHGYSLTNYDIKVLGFWSVAIDFVALEHPSLAIISIGFSDSSYRFSICCLVAF